MEASRIDGFDDFGECGKILLNFPVCANKLNSWKRAMLTDLTILVNLINVMNFTTIVLLPNVCNLAEHLTDLTNLAILANVTNLVKFHQITKSMQIS